jgi:MoaD family protein
MMMIRVFGSLRDAAGGKVIEVPEQGGATVGALLHEVAAAYPALGARILDDAGGPRNSVHVLVNGRSIRFLDGVSTPLHAGDRLALFPAVGGG